MRIQVTIDDRHKDQLEFVREVTDCKDFAALLSASLTAFRWMVWEVGQGRTITSIKEGDPKERVLVMKELQSVEQRLPGIIEKIGLSASAKA